eukprot:363761-Chlamydomonas_euryale.AAC.27
MLSATQLRRHKQLCEAGLRWGHLSCPHPLCSHSNAYACSATCVMEESNSSSKDIGSTPMGSARATRSAIAVSVPHSFHIGAISYAATPSTSVTPPTEMMSTPALGRDLAVLRKNLEQCCIEQHAQLERLAAAGRPLQLSADCAHSVAAKPQRVGHWIDHIKNDRQLGAGPVIQQRCRPTVVLLPRVHKQAAAEPVTIRLCRCRRRERHFNV